MKNIAKITFYVYAGILIMFNSCIKEDIIIDPDYSRPINIAAPAYKAHFSAKDLLDEISDNDYIYVDETGLIISRLVDTTFSLNIDEIIEFKDITVDYNYDIDPNLKSTNKVYSFVDTITPDLKKDQRIDSILLNNGNLEITVNLPSGFTGTWNVEFPEITLADGKTVSFSGTIGGQETQDLSLSGASVIFFQNDNDESSFRMNTTIDATATGTPTSTTFDISFRMTNTLPEKLFGYFGSDTITKHEGNIDITFFDTNEYLNDFEFKDVKLSLVNENNIGVSIASSLDTVIFSNASNEELFLQIPDDNTIKQEQAVYNPDNETVTPTSDSLIFNRDNSNITDIINLVPNKLYYSISEITNPDGNTGTQNFFINNGNSSVRSYIRIDVPLWFRVEKYEHNDTIDFDVRDIVGDSTNIDYVDSMNIYYEFNNGLPFSIYSQAYVLDDNFNVIDSLFTGNQQIWKSPPVDPAGVAQGTALTSVVVSLDYDKVKKMYDNYVTKMIIRSVLNTGDNKNPQFVKLQEDYIFEMKMSFDIKSSYKPF